MNAVDQCCGQGEKFTRYFLSNSLAMVMKATMNGKNINQSHHALTVFLTMAITSIANDQVFNNKVAIYKWLFKMTLIQSAY